MRAACQPGMPSVLGAPHCTSMHAVMLLCKIWHAICLFESCPPGGQEGLLVAKAKNTPGSTLGSSFSGHQNMTLQKQAPYMPACLLWSLSHSLAECIYVHNVVNVKLSL